MAGKNQQNVVARSPRKSAFNRASSMVRKRAEDLGRLAATQLESELEKRVWPEVRKRLIGENAVVPVEERREHYNDFDLQTRFNELIEQSLTDDRKPARIRLFKLITAQLLPDEARIMSAMSDDEPRPLIQLYSAGRIALGGGHRVSGNYSDVGRDSGLLNLDLVPTYLHHLMNLGLLSTGPESAALRQDYDKLETDTGLRVAISKIEENPSHKAKLHREVLLLTRMGREFCGAVMGGVDIDDVAAAVEPKRIG